MNKKVMALAVASAFAAPTAAMAQASNVQIFGTMYMEYSYTHQGQIRSSGAGAGGDLVNIDLLQTPGSEIGFKGEEALGGGTAVWFQCTSTADIRGGGTGSGIQGFCGRNSAVGVKGSFGNAYAGNWDMPMKKTAGAVRIVSDTGIFGAGIMLFGNSSTFNDGATATAFSRRQNNTIFYDTPVWNGFQAFAGVSTPSTGAGASNNATGAKPRAWGLAANYTNGPLLITAGYEGHQNFNAQTGATNANTGVAIAGLNGAVSTNDSGYQLGVAYQFGPVKAGLLYTQQKFDFGNNGAPIPGAGVNGGADGKVSVWNIAGEWAITGPHALRGGYTKANSTSGSWGGLNQTGGGTQNVQVGNRVFNQGAGNTGGSIWQVQYVYNASKRTEFTAGYVALSQDSSARYSLGGVTAPAPGQSQNAFAVSIKNTF
jgi:predicted porin